MRISFWSTFCSTAASGLLLKNAFIDRVKNSAFTSSRSSCCSSSSDEKPGASSSWRQATTSAKPSYSSGLCSSSFAICSFRSSSAVHDISFDALTVAVRGAPVSRLISPTNAPFPRSATLISPLPVWIYTSILPAWMMYIVVSSFPFLIAVAPAGKTYSAAPSLTSMSRSLSARCSSSGMFFATLLSFSAATCDDKAISCTPLARSRCCVRLRTH
mmetsp:Transcript_26799/g.87934  ORF Transcript_26799/g.87934 Transcript_26799/m.87934 type:complete len:215 (+) Transcript_26799:642-1286(+)